MLGSDDLTKRFLDEIKLRAYDDKYIDRREEREILQYAISAGVAFETARAAFLEACAQRGFLVESKLLAQVSDQLEPHRRSTLTRKHFDEAAGWLQKQAQGVRSERDCIRLVVELVEKGGYRIQAGWLSNWLVALKKEKGLE
jgi:hypothetical protein